VRSNAGLLFLALSLAACSTSHEPPSVEGRVAALSEATAAASATAAPAAPLDAPPKPEAPASASANASAARAVAAPPGDRIYAKARFVWIQPAPRPSKGWIGYLTLGGSVRLLNGDAEAAKTIGPGCDAWYKVEPTGFVCLGPETTLDPSDPTFVLLKKHAGAIETPFPYAYGESVGTPRYSEAPDEAEQRKREWDLEDHRKRLTELGIDANPAGVPFPSLPQLSPLVREARANVARGSTVAWSAEYDAFGRTFLYTSDHALVPKDRVKPYPRSSYAGIKLEGDTKLPIAFFRTKDRPKYKRDGEAFTETGASFSRLGWVMLTGEEVKRGAQTFLETKEQGIWIRAEDAAVAAPRDTIPFRKDEQPNGRRTWVDVSILTGTLVAYEGTTPVFATMIAAGRGGLPVPGHDPISTASTPTGTFRVDGKFKTATMVSSTDSSIVHSDVQFVQNFHGAHALHGAYWHDAWGELKSGGCVNLSPIDSKFLFEWSEPRLPADWHGIRSTPDLGPPTRVVVRP
jgi:hypothetical protein